MLITMAWPFAFCWNGEFRNAKAKVAKIKIPKTLMRHKVQLLRCSVLSLPVVTLVFHRPPCSLLLICLCPEGIVSKGQGCTLYFPSSCSPWAAYNLVAAIAVAHHWQPIYRRLPFCHIAN